MPGNWKTYKLGELVTKLGDGIHGTPKYNTNGEYYFINGNNLVDDKILIKPDTKRVSKNEYEKHKRELNERTLLVSINGTIGRVAYYNNEKVMLGKSACYFNLKDDVDKAFIKHVISSKYFIDYLESNYTGSVIKNVSLKSMREMPINLPPLPEQKAIASILSALDDKIENNLAMNRTLEDMAMALYKHWFVDFVPFQEANFIDSELGPIPEGWEVKELENLIDTLSKGTTPRKKDVDNLASTIPFLKVKDIDDFGLINESSLEHIPASVHNKQLKRSILKTDDILISIAGTIGRTAIVPSNLDNANCNQALAFVRLMNKELNNGFVYLWINSIQTQNEINLSIVQGVQANVSLGVLKSLKFVYPPEKILKDFNNPVLRKLEMISVNRKENQTLTQLRDTLLPKLISGEVRLKEFEQLVTAAL